MSIIEVLAIMMYTDGIEDTFFGGETGTAEFYIIKHTLQKYLGNDLLYYNHDNEDTFIIENFYDEGCDNLYDHVKIINQIHEPFAKNRTLKFAIINLE